MTLRKYRSVSEMPAVRALHPLDSDNLRVACELTELAYRIRSWRLEPGVHKFGSSEEAFRYWRNHERQELSGQAAKDVADLAAPVQPSRPGVPLVPARSDERPVSAAVVNRLRDDS